MSHCSKYFRGHSWANSGSQNILRKDNSLRIMKKVQIGNLFQGHSAHLYCIQPSSTILSNNFAI
jgi:hypothetical protein